METFLTISSAVSRLQSFGHRITAQRIRQYEDRHKFFVTKRTKGGYRCYTNSLIFEIAYISCLQIAGYSLKEVREILDDKIPTKTIEKRLLGVRKIMSDELNHLQCGYSR